MKRLFQKIMKSLAYVAAALVIMLAVAVGLFRLLLPRLPEYQEEIKGWADAAIGMQVEFADMNARWRLSGPELTFQGAKLTVHGADSSLLSAGEVSVGVSLIRLLKDRPARLHIVQGYVGSAVDVTVGAVGAVAQTAPGVDAIIELKPSQLASLNGRTLKTTTGGISVPLVISGSDVEQTTAVNGQVEIAVVMTDELAAPRQVTLMRGVPVVLYVLKTDSEVGFDELHCDRLGIRVQVPDRELKTIAWTPQESGTFVLMGTVTPDSRVNVVVIDAPVIE